MSTRFKHDLSRRIYARRAVLYGIFISAAWLIWLVEREIQKYSVIPIIVLATFFAMAFTRQIRGSFAKFDRDPERDGNTRKALYFFATIILSPIIAPTILILSVGSFFRSKI